MPAKSQDITRISETTISTLTARGYHTHVVSYPEDHRRRSIDLLAYRHDGKSLFLKIAVDLDDIPIHEIRELRRAGAVLGAKPLLIAKTEKGEELEDMVLYERSGVYAVNNEGLTLALEDQLYVVRRQGSYYMRVDGKKLRETREMKGYSLGDLAAILGVSRRSVYMYEKGIIDISLERALRLLDVLGEEVFKPIPVMNTDDYPSQEEGSPRSRADNADERGIIQTIISSGGRAAHMRYTAADIAARIEDKNYIIVVDHGKRDPLVNRSSDAVKISVAAEAEAVAVTRNPEARNNLESMGFSIYSTGRELALELLRQSRK